MSPILETVDLPDLERKISELLTRCTTKSSIEMEALTRLAAVRLPMDPFFAEGDAICNMFTKKAVIDIDSEPLCHENVSEFVCHIPTCNRAFSTVIEFEIHYNSWHRYSCSTCKKQLPSPHLLDMHVSETHDAFFAAAAERKPMYVCYVETCSEKFLKPEERKKHCIEEHSFPHDFKFEARDTHKKKHPKPAKKKEKKKGGGEKMDVSPPIQNQTKGQSPPKVFSFGKKAVKAFSSKRETKIDVSDLMKVLPSNQTTSKGKEGEVMAVEDTSEKMVTEESSLADEISQKPTKKTQLP